MQPVEFGVAPECVNSPSSKSQWLVICLVAVAVLNPSVALANPVIL